MKDIKVILFLLMFSVAFTMIGQTKLINHKSHSGTNQTFNPKNLEGNFGIPAISFRQILEDKKSKYKLSQAKQNNTGKIVYTLYKKAKLDKNFSHYQENDTLFLEVELSGEDSLELSLVMREMLIKKLKAYRKNEN